MKFSNRRLQRTITGITSALLLFLLLLVAIYASKVAEALRASSGVTDTRERILLEQQIDQWSRFSEAGEILFIALSTLLFLLWGILVITGQMKRKGFLLCAFGYAGVMLPVSWLLRWMLDPHEVLHIVTYAVVLSLINLAPILLLTLLLDWYVKKRKSSGNGFGKQSKREFAGVIFPVDRGQYIIEVFIKRYANSGRFSLHSHSVFCFSKRHRLYEFLFCGNLPQAVF